MRIKIETASERLIVEVAPGDQRVRVATQVASAVREDAWLGATVCLEKIQAWELFYALGRAFALNWVEVDRHGHFREIGEKFCENTIRIRPSRVEEGKPTVYLSGEEIFPPLAPLYAVDILAAGVIAEDWDTFPNRREEEFKPLRGGDDDE